MSKLKLNLDDVIGVAIYFYTEYDVGGEGHAITIEEENKEKFLDAWAKEWRRRAEEGLMKEEIDRE